MSQTQAERQQSNMQPDLRKLICEHIIVFLQYQKDVTKNSISASNMILWITRSPVDSLHHGSPLNSAGFEYANLSVEANLTPNQLHHPADLVIKK
ncbi:hypothetical protein TNCV_1071731 [Trichonephila clavipes]|nr:hypothetical protein TNCV_1071731 [Trichonephila clavipes]